jgi:hypothetical protein
MANDSKISHGDDRKTEEEAEDRFKQRLLELGLLEEITPPLSPEQARPEHEPATVSGNAVSELLMRERR